MSEPPAGMRQYAKMLRELYVALRQEGFTAEQAMSLLNTNILAHANPPKEEDE
jgi:hypothetical protein